MSSDELWQWRTDVRDDRAVLALSGEIDLSGTDRLRELLRETVSQAGLVDVDLARVTFIDSSVLGVLVNAHRDASEAGGCLSVVNAAGHVRRVLDLTGVLPILSGGAA